MRAREELEPFAHEHSFRAELSDPQLTALPLLASASEASDDSLRDTTKYATPSTLPFTRERDTHEAAPPLAKSAPSPRRLIVATGALIGLLATLFYWLQMQQQAEAPQQIVRPASITERSAATQPAAAEFIERTEDSLPNARDGFELLPSDASPPPAAPAPSIPSDKPIKRAQPRPSARDPHPVSKPAIKAKPKPSSAPPEVEEPDLDALGDRL